MHHSLWDPFPVKVGHLVREDHILDQQGSPRPRGLQIQLVSDGMATSCCQGVWSLMLKTLRKKNKIFTQLSKHLKKA